MHIFQQAQIEELTDCPYLADQRKRYCYFLAGRVDEREMSLLLAEGWRKFGLYFFRPECPQCRNCVPLRVRVPDFSPSRSQRRILKKAQDVEVRFGPLTMTEQIYELYRRHSEGRFGQSSDPEDFFYNFYVPSCPALQTELYYQNELIGAGFLDLGSDCLNSVYFFYDPAFAHLHPGTLGALHEIEHARRLGLSYYYLGYYVPGCSRMGYKDHFRPREHYSWTNCAWLPVEGPPEAPLNIQ